MMHKIYAKRLLAKRYVAFKSSHNVNAYESWYYAYDIFRERAIDLSSQQLSLNEKLNIIPRSF